MKGKFKNLKIKKKLSVTFISIIAVFIISVLTAIIGLTLVGNELTGFYNEPYQNVKDATLARRNVQSAMKNMISAISTSSAEKTNNFITEADEDMKDLEKNLDNILSRTKDESINSNVEKLKNYLQVSKESRTKIIELARSNDSDHAALVAAQEKALNIYGNEYLKQIDPALELLIQIAEEQDVMPNDAFQSANTLQMVRIDSILK